MSLPQPLQVGVARGQRPLAGAIVRFETQIGGGTLQGTGQTSVDLSTGPDGVARCTWRLGSAAASQQVLAQLLDATGTPIHLPVRFNATIGLSGLDAAVHVKGVTLTNGVPLDNDTSVPANRFADGLVITCDTAIEQDTVRNRPTCVVTVEVPFPLSDSDTKLWASPIFGYQPIRLAADTDADTNKSAINWLPTQDAKTWLAERLFAVLPKEQGKVLAHLVLLGNFVWQMGKPEVWVDADLFGSRGQPGEAFPTLGRWPTGDGRRGGTLHMWFWLTPPEHIAITIDPPKTDVSAGGQKDFTVSVAGTANKAVKFDPIDLLSGSIQAAQGRPGVWTYTAPKLVTARRTVSITAESMADPNQRTTALVTLLPGSTIPPPVVIEPDKADLASGGQREFKVRAEGADDATVEVSLDPPSGLGTLTLVNKDEGRWIFKAPSKVDKPTTVSIVARSSKAPDDPVKAVVSLRPAPENPQGPSRTSASAPKQGTSRAKASRRSKKNAAPS
jgi:hypothetical protein